MWRLRSLFLVVALLTLAAGLAQAQKSRGFKLVAAQGMNRRQWEETLAVMTAKHGMPNLEGKDRELVLNYLETTYPPRSPAGGWQSPFLKR
jgi:hypothetical protein